MSLNVFHLRECVQHYTYVHQSAPSGDHRRPKMTHNGRRICLLAQWEEAEKRPRGTQKALNNPEALA